MFFIAFNDKTNQDLKAAVTSRPTIPAPVLRGEYVDVAGRNGSLFQTDGTYENIEISVPLNYIRPQNEVGDVYRKIKAWINGPGVLRVSDDPSIYYKVKFSGISSAQRRTYFGADLVATFICDPFTYFEEGKTEIDPGTIENEYFESRPLYKITGSGTATLTVNGKTFEAVVNGNLTIDTDLMISYREGYVLANADVTGDYDDLVLTPGENTVSVSSGFTLKIVPNWRSL